MKILTRSVITLHYLISQTSISLHYPWTHLIVNIRCFHLIGDEGAQSPQLFGQGGRGRRQQCWHIQHWAAGWLWQSLFLCSPSSASLSRLGNAGWPWLCLFFPPCSPADSVHIVLWYFRQGVLTAKHKSH